MTRKPSNPPAFPFVTQTKTSGSSTIYTNVTEGMTLRDWFAGQFGTACAAALLAGDWDIDARKVAQAAYVFSDAMLAERENGK